MSQHTPGEWSLHRNAVSGDFTVMSPESDEPVCFISSRRGAPPPSKKQAQDNARVMAGASALLSAAQVALEALTLSVWKLGLDPDTHPACCALRAAIKKAKHGKFVVVGAGQANQWLSKDVRR